MSLLLFSAVDAGPVAEKVRIGDVVHLADTSRPDTRRCCPAIVTRVMAQGTRKHPPLQVEEHVQYSGNSKAQHPTGGWLHALDAPQARSSWHTRAECPDER